MPPIPRFLRTLCVLAILSTSSSAIAQSSGHLSSLPAARPDVEQLWPNALRTPEEERAPKRRTFGLHVENSQAGIVTGSFSAGTETIYFEVVRGGPNDSADADAPPYGLDIRIMDRDHTPFVLRTNGTTPMKAAWYGDTLQAESQPIDVEARQRAFALFPRAARALRAYTTEHPDSQPEIAGLIELLTFFTVEELHDIDGVPERPGIAQPQAAAPTQYSHKATIRKKRSNINLPWREYEHSAVLLQIYKPGGALLTSWETSNHGTAATSSLMSSKCSKTFTKTHISFNVWDIMCESYGSVWPATHLCNNDTRQEYLSIKYSSTKNWGVCWGYMKYAPDCD